MYSAVKKDGKRLYELARQGIQVEREARKVTVFALALTGAREAAGEYTLSISCSAGTYVRTLIHDLGQALGCGAAMTSLRRTKACGFSLDDCLTLEEARALSEKGTLGDRLLPVDAGLSGYQAVQVTDAQFTRFRNGGALFLARVDQAPKTDGAFVRVYNSKGRFTGLGMVDEDVYKRQGETVYLRLIRPLEGRREFKGTLTGFADGVIELTNELDGVLRFLQKDTALCRLVDDYFGG